MNSSAESVSVRDVIDDSNDVSCTRVGEQFVSDSIDIQMTSPYGLWSIHAMGRIMVTPESSYHATETEIERVQVPPREKEDLLQKLEIKIQPYYLKNNNGFTSVSFIPIDILMQRFNMIVTSCPGDTAWLLGWVSKQKLNPMLKHPSWKGFMKSIHNESGMEKSVIEFLPIINAPPDSFSTIYTTIIACLKLSTDLPMMITFDLPLWSKAARIILDSNLPVIPRLGGIHQLMSFTSAIGYLMTGSGIEECLEIVFPGFPVEKLLSGKSHEKTLQAHFLIDAALCTYLMEDVLSNDELEQVLDEIERTKEGKYGTSCISTFMSGMAQKLQDKLDSTERLGRTQSLWIRYHEHIQIVRDFIRAERLSDIQLHIDSSAKMLTVMMAAGHSQYGKAIRFTLQQFMQFDGQTKAFFISNKHQSVKYSSHEWCGIW